MYIFSPSTLEKFGSKNICLFYIKSKSIISYAMILKPKIMLFPFSQNESEVAMYILINLKLLVQCLYRAKCHAENFIRR